MSDTTETTTETVTETAEKQTEQGISQAEVDRIVKDRVARERAKYADYDELKAKAEGAKTVEQKLADLEGQLTASNARAMRSDVAAKYGISAEDRDLFLTGTDAEALEAQAKRLAEHAAEKKKQGNVARKEGATTTPGGGDDDLREATRALFGRTD